MHNAVNCVSVGLLITEAVVIFHGGRIECVMNTRTVTARLNI